MAERSGFGRIVGPAVITAWFVVTMDVILMKQMEIAGLDYAYLLILVPALIFIICGAFALWREGPLTRDVMIGTTIGLYFGGFAYLLFDTANLVDVARTEIRSERGAAPPQWGPLGLDRRP